jgi:Bifunctional DNA primase/polymerase, N-terminal/AAA domain/Primase C terminal 1 (PriCT-1)
VTRLEQALDYRRRGFSVIPIKPKDKKPLIFWEPYQTEPAAEATIKHWCESWPNANIGLVTGAVSGCIVIDLDTDKATKEFKSLLGNDYDFSLVPRSRTGKGFQLFFKHPGGSIPNRAGVLPNMDVRADGGYVVVPPSIHPNGKEYKWEVPLGKHLPKPPDQLLRIIQAPNHNEQGYRERFDTARALAGVPEGQRDDTIFKLTCKLRNADVPREMAETLVTEAARNCQPPFPERMALDKVARVYNRHQPKEPKEQQKQKQAEIWPELLSAKDLLQLPPDPTRWIWDRTLPAGGASILVAKPKIGKTHLAVNLAIAVSRGIPFLGRDTQQCGVVYLSLDASLPEITETLLSFGLKETDPVFVHAGAAPVEALKWVMQRANEKGARFVIVDTLQRLFRFQNVNDYSEVTNALEPLLEAAREQNCHVLFTHHAKKDASDDLDSAIGSTAIRGLAHTYLHMKRLPNSERRILRSDQRSGKNIPEMAVGFGKTGWLEIQGTMEEAEIAEAIPKIKEALEAEELSMTEKEIRQAVPMRGIIVSKAIREMFKADVVERTGRGKKGEPFRHRLANGLFREKSERTNSDLSSEVSSSLVLSSSLDAPSYSIPDKGHKSAGHAGHGSEKQSQPIKNANTNSCPNKTGHERDTQGHEFASGHESETPGHESENGYWERVSR